MGMDRRKRRSLQKIEKAYLRRTSTPHAKTGGTLRAGSRRVKLCNRSNIKSKGRTRTVASGGLLLHYPLRNRTKLRHLRQRVIGGRKIPTTLENIPRRSTPPNCYPHRPLQPTILEGTEKDQSKNRLRIPRATGVQFHTQTHSGQQKRKSRRPLPKTRLRYRRRGQRQRGGTTIRSL